MQVKTMINKAFLYFTLLFNPCLYSIAESSFGVTSDVGISDRAEKKKIVVFSMRSTGGHKAVSDAMYEAFEKRNIECKVVYLEDYQFIDTGTNFERLVTSASFNPDLAQKAYNFFLNSNSAKITGPIYKTVNYLVASTVRRKKFTDLIIEEKPDAIIFVTPFGLDNLVASVGNINSIPIFIAITDVFPHVGWFISCAAKTKVHYVSPSDCVYWELKKRYRNANVEIHNINGLPLRTPVTLSRQEARASLDVSDDECLILVTSGSVGTEWMFELLQYIAFLSEEKYVCNKKYVFIFGKSQDLCDASKTFLKEHSVQHHISPIGYTKDMLRYISAADVVIGKAGPTIISEAMLCKVPCVLLDLIAHEKPNINHFIHDCRIGVVADFSPESILEKTDYIIQHRQSFVENIENYIPNAAYVMDKMRECIFDKRDFHYESFLKNTGAEDVVDVVMKVIAREEDN